MLSAAGQFIVSSFQFCDMFSVTLNVSVNYHNVWIFRSIGGSAGVLDWGYLYIQCMFENNYNAIFLIYVQEFKTLATLLMCTAVWAADHPHLSPSRAAYQSVHDTSSTPALRFGVDINVSSIICLDNRNLVNGSIFRLLLSLTAPLAGSTACGILVDLFTQHKRAIFPEGDNLEGFLIVLQIHSCE